DGKPFALLDSPLREIHDISVAADGSVYALALGESASAAKPESPAGPDNKPISAERPASPAPEPPAKSRYALSNSKSAVSRILSDGGSDLIWSSPSVTGFSLTALPTGVMIGTSDKGRIYSVTNESRETLALQTDANQISTIIESRGQFLATSSNQGI